MADRGRGSRSRGRGQFRAQPFPNRGRSDGSRGRASHDHGGFRGGTHQGASFHSDRGRGARADRGRGHSTNAERSSSRGGRGGSPTGSVKPFMQEGQVYRPSNAVTELEEKIFEPDFAVSLEKMSVNEKNQIPVRPAYGSKGQRITLWANYFELLPSKDQPLHRYDISFAPAVAKEQSKAKGISQGEQGPKKQDGPTGKKLERCVQLLLKELPETVALATDYRSTIIAQTKLRDTQKDYLVSYYAETESSPGPRSPKYTATVKYTGSPTFGDLLDYLSSTDLVRERPMTKDAMIQAINIIIASRLKSNATLIAKKNKYFSAEGDLKDDWPISIGLQAFRGFFMSVRAATGRLLLNVQVQHVVAWQAIPMTKLLSTLLENPYLRERMGYPEVARFIAGTYVHVSHLNGRLKRIAGFAQKGDGASLEHPPRISGLGADANNVQFWKDSPPLRGYVTIAKYFENTYRPLKDPRAPVLNVGTKGNPVYIPSELCTIKRFQTYDKKLSPGATARMIGQAVRPAPDNARTITEKGLAMLNGNSLPMMQKFEVGLNQTMLTVFGRVLPRVSVQYANRARVTQDASWNMQKVTFSQKASLKKWTYLWIKTPTVDESGFADIAQVRLVMQGFQRTLNLCGVQAPGPTQPYELDLHNISDPGVEIDNIFSQVSEDIQLLLVILPFRDTAIYNAVKCAGDIKYGIHTVGVVADKTKFCKALFPGRNGQPQQNDQYYANVALKINLKLGGRNQSLAAADLGFVSEGKTMIVGLDVTHPSPGSSEKAPSISSITASIDGTFGQWPADIALQRGREEMVRGLKAMFLSRLTLWRKHQNRLPDEILIYRDGVGESMYDKVRNEELPLIREACEEVYSPMETKAKKPYITIVICGKRHHTRFYPTDENEADPRTGGTKSGTVVDRGITEARVWDFYLQAHTALNGTPKSAHYVVIHDEIFRRRAMAKEGGNGKKAGQQAADDLEQLTHSMCYMFGRATKAVSLCPPAYYADIACERGRAWLSRLFEGRSAAGSEQEARDEEVRVHKNLRDTMFYI